MWRLRARAAAAPACRWRRSARRSSPPSGPISISQSALPITSRLCSITSSEWPLSSSLPNAPISRAMSSKCRPVVGSSKIISCAPAVRRLREVTRELQALRLAARQRRHRLAEPQVVEADVAERREPREHVRRAGEERQRLRHRHVEHVGDVRASPVRALDAQLQDLVAEAPAVAGAAAQVHVRQQLHLDVLEAVAAAGRAAASAGVEAERARRVVALDRLRQLREERADRLERADVARRVRAGRSADRRLVDQHHVGQRARGR